MDLAADIRILILSIVYAVVGLFLLLGAFWIFDLFTPANLGKEIFEGRNTAAAIMAGFFVLAIALIIAAAIHG
ncbi:MAG: DUF350 domain-containing protein [Dehalococcoidia bacterium]